MSEEKRQTLADVLESAYIEGFRKGVEAYAWWKDGEQFVGSGRYSLSDARKSSAEDAKPMFDTWLERQREAFKG
jgi:hypothetical protein